MSSSLASRLGAPDGYFVGVRRLDYSLLAALTLLVPYEVLLWLGHDGPTEVRNGAEVWLRNLLAGLGLSHWQLNLVVIVLLLLGLVYLRRHHGRGIRLGLAAGMLLEALLWSTVLRGVLPWLTPDFSLLSLPSSSLLAADLLASNLLASNLLASNLLAADLLVSLPSLALALSTEQAIALSLGAGLFEEVVFRVVLVGCLIALFGLLWRRWLAVGLGIVVAAFLFSLAHYVGPHGDLFALESFLYRWIAGLLFSLLFYWRGFAITAYAHAAYDVQVFLL